MRSKALLFATGRDGRVATGNVYYGVANMQREGVFARDTRATTGAEAAVSAAMSSHATRVPPQV
jgi:hypothetical protein